MSKFLWIEDFENNVPATVAQIFGATLPKTIIIPDNRYDVKELLGEYGIQLELSFQDGRRFIENPAQLQSIDYIILDIDLPPCSEGDDIDPATLNYLQRWHGYQKTSDSAADEQLLEDAGQKLKKVAGYHLYVALIMDCAFPRDHILICSNHGENLQSIRQAFNAAMIESPTIYTKSTKEVREAVKKLYDTPYAVLRRGIIDACQWVEEFLHDDDQIAINKLIHKEEQHLCQDDIRLNWQSIKNVLPLREPEATTKSALLLQLLRVVAHIGDSIDPWKKGANHSYRASAQIIKMCRNWSAHGLIFNQEPLSEAVAAYVILMNLRAVFDYEIAANDALLPHEQTLLRVFELTQSDQDTCLNRREKLPEDLCCYVEKWNLHLLRDGYEEMDTSKPFIKLLNRCAEEPTLNDRYRKELLRGFFVSYWIINKAIAESIFKQEFERVFAMWCFPRCIE